MMLTAESLDQGCPNSRVAIELNGFVGRTNPCFSELFDALSYSFDTDKLPLNEHEKSWWQRNGGPSKTRTCDQGIMSPLL